MSGGLFQLITDYDPLTTHLGIYKFPNKFKWLTPAEIESELKEDDTIKVTSNGDDSPDKPKNIKKKQKNKKK